VSVWSAQISVLPANHGWKMAGFLLASFYAAMVAAGLIVEFVFDGLNLIPNERKARWSRQA
jgi:hypothetical protein